MAESRSSDAQRATPHTNVLVRLDANKEEKLQARSGLVKMKMMLYRRYLQDELGLMMHKSQELEMMSRVET